MQTLPPPLDLAGALSAACEQLQLAPTALQAQQLLGYLALLKRWNSTYNLTAVRDEAAMLTQHLADCLAVIGPLRRELVASAEQRLLDVGSGAGLPGCVIAIMEPGLRVVCIDSVGKKAAFMRQTAAALGLGNLLAEHGRVEALAGEPFGLIASRAFASLSDFFQATQGCASDRTIWMAMKGRSPAAELSALPHLAEVFHVEQLAVPGLAAERCLVWMRRRVAFSPIDGDASAHSRANRGAV